jgi:4-aminobutyrate aminotransferase-like enzyme
MEQEKLIENAGRVGAYLREGLSGLARRHPLIGDVRGEGRCVGVKLVRREAADLPATSAASSVVNGLRERHILISSAGPGGNVLKIRPPLPFSRDNADQLIEALDDTLRDCAPYAQT